MLYDVMLDTYEKGFNMEMLDPFFELMKGKIVPLLKESAERSKMVPDAFFIRRLSGGGAGRGGAFPSRI